MKWLFFPAFAHHCLSVNLEDFQEYSGPAFPCLYASKSLIMGNPKLQGSSLAVTPHGQSLRAESTPQKHVPWLQSWGLQASWTTRASPSLFNLCGS